MLIDQSFDEPVNEVNKTVQIALNYLEELLKDKFADDVMAEYLKLDSL